MKKVKIYAEVLEDSALEQFNKAMSLECNVQGALMPDAHSGYTLPIGAVVKSKDKVFPAFVGYDIGCGVLAIELDIHYSKIDLVRLKEHILSTVPLGFTIHEESQEHDTLDFNSTSCKLQDLFSTKGVKAIGTLGGGNHFIEVGYTKSNGNVTIVIHSGSRGFGHAVASYYMNEAASQSAESGWNEFSYNLVMDFVNRNKEFFDRNPDGYYKAQDKYMDKQKEKYMKTKSIEGLHSFDINSRLGKQYMIDQNFCLEYCLEYALYNRKAMIARIFEGIFVQNSCRVEEFINRNHNHAELKDGYIIHRKGATHAEKGMMGVIPANMRDGSFIVKGKGNEESLCSSSHGAGRVLSRRKAKETLDINEFRAETSKMVTNHTDAMLDESPSAYKDIFEVMKLQEDLVEVVDRVMPILNIKG